MKNSLHEYWGALEKFSKEKRPPIGYRPFLEACVDADVKGEALKYIPKLVDPEEKAGAYAHIGMAELHMLLHRQKIVKLKLTFAQNAVASSVFNTLRDILSLQSVS